MILWIEQGDSTSRKHLVRVSLLTLLADIPIMREIKIVAPRLSTVLVHGKSILYPSTDGRYYLTNDYFQFREVGALALHLGI